MRIGFGSKGAGGGDDGSGREEPPPDVYEAKIACIEDVGNHEERGQPGVTKRKVVVGLEIDWRTSKGRRPSLFKKFNCNLWSSSDGSKKSDFRTFLDTVIPEHVAKAQAKGEDVDTGAWVGKTVRVTVEHDARGRSVVRGFLKSKVSEDSLRIEGDWSQPFGLWKWLIENSVS